MIELTHSLNKKMADRYLYDRYDKFSEENLPSEYFSLDDDSIRVDIPQDETKIKKLMDEKVLYRMRHNKYDSLRKSYNKVIKNKVNDVKQGLYQTIYLTLTIMAEDVADAKAHLVLWRVP